MAIRDTSGLILNSLAHLCPFEFQRAQQRSFGLFEQLPGVSQMDFRLVYAAAASGVCALK